MAQRQDPQTAFLAQLRKDPFFENLDENSLASLGTEAKRYRYQPGELVFGEGEASQGLYWLQTGTLKAVKYSSTGREQILHLINAGQTFNEVGSFTTLPNPASIMALTAAQVWHIPGEKIRHLLQYDPHFAQLIIDVLSKRLRDSVALVEDLSLRPVMNRLSRLILEEADGDILSRPAWYTQNELAARLGTVADVIQRALSKLEVGGVIEVNRNQIRIIDHTELENLAE